VTSTLSTSRGLCSHVEATMRPCDVVG
jgi:hypothetical protein